MPTIHYLNVGQGDCSIIQHGSGRVTMVDVNKARQVTKKAAARQSMLEHLAVQGNFNQKEHPDNPIAYMQARGIGKVFRFILTHPDMDHMDGLADIFAEFSPPNFWDTDNTCDMDGNDWDSAPYRKEDWDIYASLRKSKTDPKRLLYLSGEPSKDFWNKDGLLVLSPTTFLLETANELDDWNDASYVLLYRTKSGRRAIFPGDSHEGTWKHILDVHADKVSNIDLLIAPHHGRGSDRDFKFLDILNPRLTLFGNASSEHLAYDAWNSRNLPHITNNQAGSIIVDFDGSSSPVYCTNKVFAEAKMGSDTFFHEQHGGWFLGGIDDFD
jgi:competence protein ComEC